MARLVRQALLFGVGLFYSFSVHAQVGDSFSHPEARREIALAWAPSIYQDSLPEMTSAFTGFNPVDHPVSLFFDGNMDLRDNGITIFKLGYKKTREMIDHAPIYFSLIETDSHYYINYFIYHALDTNAEGHVHDTENIFTIVEKTPGQKVGRLVAHITNAHGYPIIYGPNSFLTQAWRSKVVKNGFASKILASMDQYSEAQDAGPTEYIERAQGSRSIKVFSSRRSHAIYKLNEAALNDIDETGYVYLPEQCEECTTDSLAKKGEGVREYQLVDWDELMEKLLTLKDENFVFTATALGEKLPGSIYRERDLPENLREAENETEARVNLFYTNTFKTPSRLSDPASVHAFFASDDKNISHHYIFNPYLKEVGKEPPLVASRPLLVNTSFFSLISQLWSSSH